MEFLGEIKFDGETLYIEQGSYAFGTSPRIFIDSDNGPFAVLSVNLEGHPNATGADLLEDEFVVDHNLLHPCHGSLLSTLLESGLFEDTGRRCRYGFCEDVPIWKVKGQC